MPAKLHLPEKTTNCTYLRIHGGRGYKGDYDSKQLQNIKRAVLAKHTTTNYVIFNNVGAYTIVLKPPFIKPSPPIVTFKGRKCNLIRREEKFEDIFLTYQI